jgi:TPR repeat protein
MASKIDQNPKQAFTETLKDARLGLPQAQYQLGLMYANGVGVKRNYVQALAWVRKAAERGLPAAQYLLGTRYESGSSVAQSDQAAFQWFTKAAEQGHPRAFYRLARLHGSAHAALAEAHHRRAAALGVAESQWILGAQALQAQAPEEALSWMRKAAEQGLAAAQCALGTLHQHGHGVEPDRGEALRWFRKAAAQSWPAAQVALSRIEAGEDDDLPSAPGRMGRGRRAAPASRQEHSPADQPNHPPDADRWDQLADPGDADARYHLGLMYEEGLGVAPDALRARAWYGLAAQQDDGRAQSALARLLELEADPQAVVWHQRAAEQGLPESQFALGQILSAGHLALADPVQGTAWTLRAAENGHPQALTILADLFSGPTNRLAAECLRRAAEQGEPQAQFRHGQQWDRPQSPGDDPSQAFRWYLLAAEQGYAPAQSAVGACHLSGRGAVVDIPLAAAWLRQAAEQGEAKAQWQLGSLCGDGGPGFKRDLKQAFVWCQKAAEQDFLPAQATLARWFVRMEQPEKARAWWTRAAEKGDMESQYNLAMALWNDPGPGKDTARSFHYLHRAAAQGLTAAQTRLGILYATGDGVAIDPIEAHKWFAIASLAGDHAASQNRQRSAGLITTGQRAEGERRARDWAEARQTRASDAPDRDF